MNTQKTEEWEKEFDERFGNIWITHIPEEPPKNKYLSKEEYASWLVKQFIKNLLSQSQSDTRMEIRENIDNERITGEPKIFENSAEIYGNKRLEAYKKGVNETIDKILSLPSLKVAEDKEN